MHVHSKNGLLLCQVHVQYYCNSHPYFFLLQVSVRENVTGTQVWRIAGTMQWLCSLEFYLVAENTHLQGLLLKLRMPSPNTGLQRSLWAVCLVLSCNTGINTWSFFLCTDYKESMWFLLQRSTTACIIL